MVRNVDVNINVQDNLKQAQTRLKTLTGSLDRLKRLQLSLKQKIINAKQIDDKGRVKQLNQQLRQTKLNMEKVNMEIRETNQQMQGLTKSTSNFHRENTMNFLSLMFFGMMLYNVFSRATKALFEGYKKAIPEASKFNVLTNKMSANWEYFKFQLADALANSSLFQKFIGFVVNILQWLQKLSPETKKWIAVLIPVTAALGGALFLIGQIGLAIPGLTMLFGGFKKSVTGFTWGKVGKISILIGVIAALYTLKKAYDDFTESSDYAKEKVKKQKAAFDELVTVITDDIVSAFSKGDTKIKNSGQAWVAIGAMVNNVMLGIAEAALLVYSGLRYLVNGLTIIVRFITGSVVGALMVLTEALVNFYDLVTDNDLSGFKNTLDIIKKTANGITTDIDDMADTTADFNKVTDALSSAWASPTTAVEKFNEELKKIEQQNKAKKFIDDLMSNGKSSTIPNINKKISDKISEAEKAVSGGIPSARKNVNQQTVNVNMDGTNMFRTSGSDVGKESRIFTDEFLEESGLKTQMGNVTG